MQPLYLTHKADNELINLKTTVEKLLNLFQVT